MARERTLRCRRVSRKFSLMLSPYRSRRRGSVRGKMFQVPRRRKTRRRKLQNRKAGDRSGLTSRKLWSEESKPETRPASLKTCCLLALAPTPVALSSQRTGEIDPRHRRGSARPLHGHCARPTLSLCRPARGPRSFILISLPRSLPILVGGHRDALGPPDAKLAL